MKIIENIKPSDLTCNVFSAYDYNGLSLQELLSQFFTKINECINQSNEMKTLADYLVNEGLTKEVADKLMTWLTDGTLENIINVNLFNSLHEKMVNFEKVGEIPSNDLKQDFILMSNNNTFYLNDSFTIETLHLKDKENITIIGGGKITQETSYVNNPSYEQPISEKPLIKIENCKNIRLIGIDLSIKYESVDIVNCENITIENCIVSGDKNTSRYNGIVSRDSANITLINCVISECAKMPTYNTSDNLNNYSLGNGIAFYNVDGCNVINCTINNCGQNGIYTFACDNINFTKNIITNNGMSGIQIAFGKGSEKNYIIESNIIEGNYSDGIDINNTMNNPLNINCILSNNMLNNNGWFLDKTKPTQDGSGLATLINVNGVTGKGNIVGDCCRTGLYISNCIDISLDYKVNKSVKGNGSLLYIGGSKNINIQLNGIQYCGGDNAIAIDSTYKDNENININNSYIYSETMLPIYTKGVNKHINVKINNSVLESKKVSCGVDNTILFDNIKFICHENKGINLADNVTLKNCEIKSLSQEGLYISDNSTLINCNVYGSKGCVVWGKSNVKFINTEFIGTDNGVRIDGTNNTYFSNCIITGTSHGLHTNGNSNIKLFNTTLNTSNGNSIRCESGTTIYTDNNVYNGHAEFSNATKKEIQWT